MTSMQKRGTAETLSPFGRLDRMFDEWLRALPMRRMPGMGYEVPGEELIRVDEYREGDTQVIRAELPGIDPDKDVDLTVADGMLRIHAQRRVEEKTEDKGYAARTALRHVHPHPADARGRLRVRHRRVVQGRHARDPHSGRGAHDARTDEDPDQQGLSPRSGRGGPPPGRRGRHGEHA